MLSAAPGSALEDYTCWFSGDFMALRSAACKASAIFVALSLSESNPNWGTEKRKGLVALDSNTHRNLLSPGSVCV